MSYLASRYGMMTGAPRATHLLSVALLLLAALCLWPAPAAAQRCSADVQCANGGRSTFQCAGDTLIVKRSVCSGTCREIEERRQDCGSRVTGTATCSGNVAVRTDGGCNAALGTCGTRVERDVCAPACSCRGTRLAVSTGQCTEGAGCVRSIVQCPKGCTCSPQPGCR
jgi:hypothetical protein